MQNRPSTFTALLCTLCLQLSFKACQPLCKPDADAQRCMLNLANDTLFQSFVDDTTHLSLECDTDRLFNYPYVRLLTLPDSLKGIGMLDTLANLYNFMAIYNTIQTDLDAIWRYEEQPFAVQAHFCAMDPSTLSDSTLHGYARRMICLSDEYVHSPSLFSATDSVGYRAADQRFNARCDSLNQDIGQYISSLTDHVDTNLTSDDFVRRFSPTNWVSDCYTTYVGEETNPTYAQIASLLSSMRSETHCDVKAAQLFTLAGSPLSVSDADEVLTEIEQIMESGIYVPTLPLLWRAYRVLYNRMYAGPSTWAYSYNLRYNHYRRLITLTSMNYLSMHPDDTMAYMLLLYNVLRADILRLGVNPFGNQSIEEMCNLFWNEQIL